MQSGNQNVYLSPVQQQHDDATNIYVNEGSLKRANRHLQNSLTKTLGKARQHTHDEQSPGLSNLVVRQKDLEEDNIYTECE